MPDYVAPTFVDNAPPALSAAVMNALAQAAQAAHTRLTSLEGAGGTEIAQDSVAAALAAGTHTGITFSYNDATGAISATVTVAGGGGSYTDEQAQDTVAAMIAAGSHSGITFAYDDANGRLSATVTRGIQVDETGAAAGKVVAVDGTSPLHSGFMDYFRILAKDPDNLVETGTITRDANDAATSAAVVWPDGRPGVYTATTVSTAFPGAVDAYTITYDAPGAAPDLTFTQPAVTRNANGAVTARPAITVA